MQSANKSRFCEGLQDTVSLFHTEKNKYPWRIENESISLADASVFLLQSARKGIEECLQSTQLCSTKNRGGLRRRARARTGRTIGRNRIAPAHLFNRVVNRIALYEMECETDEAKTSMNTITLHEAIEQR